jgi:hypothetical protein
VGVPQRHGHGLVAALFDVVLSVIKKHML